MSLKFSSKFQAETEEEMNSWIGVLQAAKYDAAGLQDTTSSISTCSDKETELSALEEIEDGEENEPDNAEDNNLDDKSSNHSKSSNGSPSIVGQ